MTRACRSCKVALHAPDPDVILAELAEEGSPTTREEVVALIEKAPVDLCDSCYSEARAADDRFVAAAQRSKRLSETGLPTDLRGLSWGDAWQSSDKRCIAILACQDWAGEYAARGLYLYGPTGVGKTMLAALALQQRCETWPVRWVSVAHLLSQLDSSFSDSDRARALRVLDGTGALVMDDLDKVSPTEHRKSQLFTAIDRRVAAGAPLLFTSNLAPQELYEKYGGPIASRVIGYSKGRVCELDGPDRRLRLEVGEA